MTEIQGLRLDFGDPVTLAWLAAAAVAALILLLLALALRAAGRSARLTAPMALQVGELGRRVAALSEGQERLSGGLSHVSDAHAQAQTAMLRLMEARLAEVQERMGESLSGSARRTAQSLGELQERLKVIDGAQERITRLSGDVLSLQDILSNKQTRGAFGEIQLQDIVSKALPADAFEWQSTLSNGRRVDCLVRLPHPPGPIAIDAKFPLEAYEALVAADDREAKRRAAQALRLALRKHIRDISERYIIAGETADSALLFLPSEAVYAELHAHFGALVREGFEARVWIVSPTTCMATLNTMRAILKDVRMREQAGAIRGELHKLSADLERLGTRVGNLDRHFGQATRDIEAIKLSAEKAGKRALRLDHFDFEDLAQDPVSLSREHEPGE